MHLFTSNAQIQGLTRRLPRLAQLILECQVSIDSDVSLGSLLSNVTHSRCQRNGLAGMKLVQSRRCTNNLKTPKLVQYQPNASNVGSIGIQGNSYRKVEFAVAPAGNVHSIAGRYLWRHESPVELGFPMRPLNFNQNREQSLKVAW